jgi:predicted HD superfamily hydrolase involved in NAD metabolism
MCFLDRHEFSRMQEWVSTQVSRPRLRHIQGVVKTSEKLALRYGLPVSKARTAAWLHDCAKELSRPEMSGWIKKGRETLDAWEKKMPGLWHPHAAVGVAIHKWGVKDPLVLEAVRCHTLGHPRMGPLAQLIFIADFVESGRTFEGVAGARKSALVSLREGVLIKASMTVDFLFQKRMKIHPRLLETWNSFCQGRT